MKLTFTIAKESDAAELAALHRAVADGLTAKFGSGFWSSAPSERGLLVELRRPKFSRTLMTRRGKRIVACLRLATKKPWAIDVSYFTPVTKALYLTGMAVHPEMQGKGVGRFLLKRAEALAREWPGNAVRLDAFDAEAGAGEFYAKCGYREVARVKYKGNSLVYFEMVL